MLRGIFTLFLLAFFGYWSILNSLISISLIDLLPLWLVKCLIVFSFFIFSDLVDLDVYKGLFPNRCSTFGSSVTFKLSVINLNVCLKNDIWSTLFAPNLFCLSDDCDLKWHLQQRFISRGSLSFILFYYFILWEEWLVFVDTRRLFRFLPFISIYGKFLLCQVYAIYDFFFQLYNFAWSIVIFLWCLCVFDPLLY
jgi:hypothetical protein